MHKLIYIFLLFFPAFGFSQTDTIAHLYSFGGDNNDSAEEVQATNDGGYIVLGTTSSNSSGNTDAYLLKVDSLCNYEWSFALGGSNNDWGYSVKQTYDNGYIVAATSNSYGNGGYDAVLMKRDSLGGYEWKRTFGGQDWDFVYSVVQTFDSGYVFCGETYNNSAGYSDVYVVRTNPVGDTLWTQTIGGALIDKGNCVIETSDSNIVVAGLTNTVSDSTQAYVIKFNKDGVLLWDSAYGGVKYENANQIIEMDDGGYAFSGGTNSLSTFEDKDYLINKIDSDGSVLWDFTITNGSAFTDNEDAFALLQLQNGNLLISGYSQTGGSNKNVVFFELSSVGGWVGHSSVIGSGDNDFVKSITFGNNGNVVGAGSVQSFGAGMEDVLLVRLDTLYGGQDTSTTSLLDIVPISVQEISAEAFFKISPNPVKNSFKINAALKSSIKSLIVFDVSGKEVYSRFSNSEFVNISNLQNGVYFVEVIFENNSSYQSKIIKH